jgi:hypothetical protein
LPVRMDLARLLASVLVAARSLGNDARGGVAPV